ncbi:MAG: cupin domain-containing protein [Hyphomonadaceae bacterium]|nr:cupin domain-containing protein [Hyphomonadaceae bacterium]
MSGPIDLSKTPLHLPSTMAGDHPYVPLEAFGFDGDSFERYIRDLCTTANPGRLVMVETSPADWSAWERHAEGDELVVILAGAGVFHQMHGETVRSWAFKAGDAFINPKGVWHTADVTEPMRALYITPCPGTEHKPRGERL